MILSDVFYWIGVLCLLTTLSIIALVWWECHCDTRAERHRANLRRDWQSARPERKL